MMDIGMYGNDHYQVGEMTSNSSAYNYYPNYHNHSHSHSHLHHHHIPTHHHQNPTAEILSAGFSPQNHTPPNQTPPVLNASNHSLGMYHEYGITMSNSDHSFYDTDSNMVQSYYQNQSNPGDPHGITTSSSSASAASAAAVTHQVTPTSTSTSSSSNDVLPETVPPSHIISSDNGLSYTNLDYTMYGNSSGHPNPLYLHQTDDKSVMAHAYNHSTQTANIENTVHSPVHSAAWQSQHPPQQHSNHSHHAPNYQLDSPANAHTVVNVNQVACLQNQATQLGANPNGIHVRTLNNRSDSINTQQNTQNQPQHGQTVQTYKWMQVKRNVPKPQGIVSVYQNIFFLLSLDNNI